MSLARRAKSAYVAILRGARGIARTTGLYRALERRLPNRKAHWWLSLLAIHDIDAMIELDVPWWSYDAIDQVAAFLKDRPGARVFEYGSGASTIWLARRAGPVISVEHDADWYPIISERTKEFANIRLDLIPPDRDFDAEFPSCRAGYTGRSFKDYATSIVQAEEPFDLIIIDGRARAACLEQAIEHLAPDGMIVFDNSGRQEYHASINAVAGDTRIFRGRVPSLPYTDQTTLIRPATT